MVTRAERGREDFRRFLNFIGPSQAQAQRRSVMTGNPIVQGGLLDPQSIAMQPGEQMHLLVKIYHYIHHQLHQVVTDLQ